MSLLRQRRFKAGDLVELRSPADVLGTLDSEGRTDGLPFMPEMLAYYGRRYRVRARVERACDTITDSSVRQIPDTVVLEDARCDGSFHGGCQAGCLIYWKEAWLQQATEGTPAADRAWSTDHDALAARVGRVVQSSDSGEPVYRCQATALLDASRHVRRREAPRSYAAEVISGNVRPGKFVRVTSRAVGEEVAIRLRLMSRSLFMPYVEPSRRRSLPESPAFKPGDLVRIRSKDDIAQTLGRNGKNKGLWFDREMARYCGRTARVLRKVDRIIDERNGRMLEMKHDCYILDGIVCMADRSRGRRFCPRGIYPYWRAAWLEPIAELPGLPVVADTPKSPVAA
jgi:hypothetical protein